MDTASTETPPLRYAPTAPRVVEALRALPRTGWVQWEVANPETVWEHTLAVRELAVRYQADLELTDDELTDLVNMLEIHDWPEATVGDGVILGDEDNVAALRTSKRERELAAMKDICAELAAGPEILALYQRYVTGADRIAKLAKQIEKLQAVQLAAVYEGAQKKQGLTAEFVHYTESLIHEPFLKQELSSMAKLFPLLVFIFMHLFTVPASTVVMPNRHEPAVMTIATPHQLVAEFI